MRTTGKTTQVYLCKCWDVVCITHDNRPTIPQSGLVTQPLTRNYTLERELHTKRRNLMKGKYLKVYKKDFLKEKNQILYLKLLYYYFINIIIM